MPRPQPLRPYLLAAILAATAIAPAIAQPAYMVADLTDYSTNLVFPLVLDVEEMNGVAYFFHDDGTHGSELWRSDGTALGTFMLRDLCPGICGSQVAINGPRMARLGNQIIFNGNDGVHGGELWRTDGTAAGTTRVLDLLPGIEPSAPGQFLVTSGQLFFTAEDRIHGRELWRTDGTPKGTWMVKDLAPGPTSSYLFQMTAGISQIFLAVGGVEAAAGLWVSNGEPDGTERLVEIGLNGVSSFKGSSFSVLGSGILVFAGHTEDAGTELWRSDGTIPGTYLLEDLVPGDESSNLDSFVVFQDKVVFRADTAPSFPSARLWQTNGLPGGTTEIALPPGVRPRPHSGMHARQEQNFLVFAAYEPTTGLEPWVYDGVTTTPLGDLRPGPDSSVDAVDEALLDHGVFAETGARVTFLADDGIHGLEFWSTDGTPPGTMRVSDLFDDSLAPTFDYLAQLASRTRFGSSLLLRQWDPLFGSRLLRSDGTEAGTGVVDALGHSSSSFFSVSSGNSVGFVLGPFCFESAGTNLVFNTLGSFQPAGIWGSDGTETGTTQLFGLPENSNLSTLGCGTLQDQVLFTGTDGTGESLWSTDGTFDSTHQVAPLILEPSGSGGVRPYFTSSETQAFFSDLGGLWATDGTEEGTENIAPLAEYFWSQIVVSSKNRIYFSDFELSVLDLGPGSTPEVIDLNGIDPSYPSDLTLLEDGTLLFSAVGNSLGAELWQSDGSAAGTSLVMDIRPGNESSIWPRRLDWSDKGFPPNILALPASAVLAADDGVHGKELWVTDGTPLGTGLLRDIYPGDYPSTPRNFTRFGDRIFFTAESELEGLELWVTDGTYDGTMLFKDIAPGGASSIPDDLVVRDGVLYFSAWTPNYGREAWKSDGTPGGTIRITDIAPGPKSSSPQRFARAGDRLFFSATDQIHGYELWAISDDGSIPIFLDGFETADTGRWSETVL